MQTILASEKKKNKKKMHTYSTSTVLTVDICQDMLLYRENSSATLHPSFNESLFHVSSLLVWTGLEAC